MCVDLMIFDCLFHSSCLLFFYIFNSYCYPASFTSEVLLGQPSAYISNGASNILHGEILHLVVMRISSVSIYWYIGFTGALVNYSMMPTLKSLSVSPGDTEVTRNRFVLGQRFIIHIKAHLFLLHFLACTS